MYGGGGELISKGPADGQAVPEFGTRRRSTQILKRLLLAILLCAAGASLALSLPLIARSLVGQLEVFPAIPPAQLSSLAAGPPTAIVVLSAGRRYAPEFGPALATESVDALSLERLRYAAYVARQTGLPVLVSGGAVNPVQIPVALLMADTLAQDYGIKAKWSEIRSTNTAENAIFSTQILKRQGIGRVILVTHAWHMERARAAFLANGMQVIAAPTAFYGLGGVNLPFDLFPSAAALRMSAYAIHENIGIVWYRLRYGY